MEKCSRLEEYAIFVAKVRMHMKNKNITQKQAITLAMNECIGEGILVDILTKQRDEGFGVILSTFNKELYEKNLKQDAYEAGHEAGMLVGKGSMLISSVENVMKNLNVSAKEACKIIGITLEEYEKAKADTE